jgi:uncharacterized protein
MINRFLLIICLLCTNFFTLFAEDLPVPTLENPVVDSAKIISSSTNKMVTEIIRNIAQSYGSEVAVVTIPNLKDETLEEFGIRIATKWKLGRKGIDDGVLLIIATELKEIRIEVGHGLEGAIPDIIAYRIIHEEILPYFKRGDLDAGIISGVNAIAKIISGEELPPPTTSQTGKTGSGSILFTFLLIIGFVGGMILTQFLGRELGAVTAAGGVFFIGLAIATFVIALQVALFTLFLLLGSEKFGGGSFGMGGRGSFGSGGTFSGGGASGKW